MIAKLQTNRVRRSYLGGSRIDAFCNIVNFPENSTFHTQHSTLNSPGAAQPRPEDWLASTTQAFNGTLEIDGEGLGRLDDGRLVRDAVGQLPILVKLLDSDERLVVQAHPTVPCARRLFNSPVGKTECWYFLPGTAPDACVYLGFKPGITREKWKDAVMVQQPLLSFLHRIPVSAGDFVFVDGGVPHAIGGGCFMIELQEPSDLMVVAERFTPSGRRIPDAKMHGGVGWEKMFDVCEYEGRTCEETCEKYVRRRSGTIDCICGPDFTDKFQMWRLSGPDGTLQLGGAAAVVVVTDGEGSLNGLAAKRGDRLVVSGEKTICAKGSLSAIACFDGCKQGGNMTARNILCWGDSITEGMAMPEGKDYPARLQALLGPKYKVFNSGDGGENSITIPARQGAVPLATAEWIVFPAGESAVRIGDENDNGFRTPAGDKIKLTAALGRQIPVNPVRIGDSDYTLFFRDFKWNTPTSPITYTLWLKRDEAVAEAQLGIPAGTLVKFDSVDAAPNAWCEIFFMGGNGGWNKDVGTLVAQFKAMVARRGEDRPYLVIVPYWRSFPEEGKNEFRVAFGRHAVEFPVEDSLCYMNRPDVHLNEDGYALLASLLHARGAELGYWPETQP